MSKDGCIKNYLDDAALKNLKAHKYAFTGESFLEYYMQKLWRRAIVLVPLWMAPNLITAAGLMVNMVTSLSLLYYNPFFDDTYETPRWAYLGCGLGVFVYQLLDALDGKQARRTNSSSPLGELFDHGCDAMSTLFIVPGVMASLQMGPYITMTSLLLGQACFYSAHWRTFVTSMMHFGRIDVTEAQWSIIIIHLCTAIFGPDIWHVEVFGYELGLWILLVVWLGSIGTLITNISSILEGGVGPEQTTVAETSIVSPAIPLLLSLLGFLYVSSFDCFLQAPWLVMLTMGVGLAKLSIRLVLCHMTMSPLEMSDVTITMPLIFFFDSFFGLGVDSLFLLSILTLVNIWNLGFYCAGVIKEITSFLHIHCFTIKPVEKTS